MNNFCSWLRSCYFKNRLFTISILIFSVVLIAGAVSASTTISTDITTGGVITVTGSGASSFIGNLGIATTSPYAPLSVVGSGGVVADNINATNTSATSTISGGLSVAGSSGLVVLQNGKVAIGTSTPVSHTLEIWGSGNFPIGYYSTADNSLQAESFGTGISNSRQAGFNFLGTTGATGSLDNWFVLRYNASGNKIVLGDTGTVSWIQAVHSLSFISGTLQSTTTPAQMTLTNSGSLGLGTSSPQSLLHVSAGTSATTTVEFGDQYASGSKTCFNVKTTTGTAASFYFTTSGLVFETSRCK